MLQVLSGSLTGRTAVLIASEHLLVIVSVVAVAIIRVGFPDLRGELLNGSLVWRASLIALVLQVCLHYCDLYDLRTLSDRRGAFTGLMQALGAASLVLAFLY